VPDFHRRAPLDAFPEWCARLRATLTPRDEVLLHGYYHLADGAGEGRIKSSLGSKLLTAGEGEFERLDAFEARRRLGAGIQMIERALHLRPTGFVAPAWLDNAEVRRACRELGLTFCEDHLHVVDLVANRSVWSPALSFASRTRLRHLGSLAWSAVAAPALGRLDLPRLAVHPLDYTKPSLVEAVADVVRRWLPGHAPIACSEVFP
jgi:predicted deacetylase